MVGTRRKEREGNLLLVLPKPEPLTPDLGFLALSYQMPLKALISLMEVRLMTDLNSADCFRFLELYLSDLYFFGFVAKQIFSPMSGFKQYILSLTGEIKHFVFHTQPETPLSVVCSFHLQVFHPPSLYVHAVLGWISLIFFFLDRCGQSRLFMDLFLTDGFPFSLFHKQSVFWYNVKKCSVCTLVLKITHVSMVERVRKPGRQAELGAVRRLGRECC